MTTNSKYITDKVAHIAVNYAIVLSLPLWWSVLVAIIASLAKEFVWDKMLGKGNFEWQDLVADAIGIAFGIVYKLI